MENKNVTDVVDAYEEHAETCMLEFETKTKYKLTKEERFLFTFAFKSGVATLAENSIIVKLRLSRGQEPLKQLLIEVTT
jgi:beta-glucosidase/6-phospho-beta-glucosidase/beta-galactosidase